MTSPGTASVKQLRLPLAPPEDEARSGLRREDAPVCLPNRMAVVLRLQRGAKPASGGREVDSQAPAVLSLLFPFQALQIGHAPKLSEIGGHEGRPKSESMGRDEHVERTDDDASLLQINAQVTIVARGL